MATEKHDVTTKDNKTVIVWSDGLVTAFGGAVFHGIGRKKLPVSNLDAFAAEVPGVTVAELPALFAKHRVAPMHPNAIVGRGARLYR